MTQITIHPVYPQRAEPKGSLLRQRPDSVTVTLDSTLISDDWRRQIIRRAEDEGPDKIVRRCIGLRGMFGEAINQGTDGEYTLMPLWVAAHAYLVDDALADNIWITSSVRNGWIGNDLVWSHNVYPEVSHTIRDDRIRLQSRYGLHVPTSQKATEQMPLQRWLTEPGFEEDRHAALLMDEDQCRTLASLVPDDQYSRFRGQANGTYTAIFDTRPMHGDERLGIALETYLNHMLDWPIMACRFEDGS